MLLYDKVSFATSKQLTLSYSTSFGLSSRLFAKEIRYYIYAIYGLVRVADEIVDTYKGTNSRTLLDSLESETYSAIESGYSANPIVHAYANTARKFGINRELIAPFFASMRIDLEPQTYTQEKYQEYIHGSAEVVGLMCLKVFCKNDNELYEKLQTGACALGSAYQKVNFLRDLGADYAELDRLYFPGIHYESLNETDKLLIVSDIRSDFAEAQLAIKQLPRSCRTAVQISFAYYNNLLNILDKTPIEKIKKTRMRVSTPRKLYLFARTVLVESGKQ